jgi:hypothetical protein
MSDRRCYLSTADLYRLDLACTTLFQFCREMDGPAGIYLVGSVEERPDFRDVDVRMILADADFDAQFGHSPGLWSLFCYAVSRWLADDTGLPIDFQVQRMTEANENHPGPRNALGMAARGARSFAGLGDATKFYTLDRLLAAVDTTKEQQ